MRPHPAERSPLLLDVCLPVLLPQVGALETAITDVVQPCEVISSDIRERQLFERLLTQNIYLDAPLSATQGIDGSWRVNMGASSAPAPAATSTVTQPEDATQVPFERTLCSAARALHHVAAQPARAATPTTGSLSWIGLGCELQPKRLLCVCVCVCVCARRARMFRCGSMAQENARLRAEIAALKGDLTTARKELAYTRESLTQANITRRALLSAMDDLAPSSQA